MTVIVDLLALLASMAIVLLPLMGIACVLAHVDEDDAP